jgi:pimeloyl-ACP methyl ester carboxylesterase
MLRTIILPGMGADSGMYPKAYYRNLPGVDFVDWPVYEGEKTIAAVARRVIEEYNITGNTIVGGSSLGGMVAVQIAKVLNLDRVILIGSTTRSSDVNPALMKLSGFAHKAPVAGLQWIAGKINGSAKNLFLAMFQKSDGRFMKAMAQAICQWRGMDGYRCDIRHIHGARDRVIFPPARDATIIPTAGHLLPMTHADEVSRFLARHTAFLT